MHIKDILAEKGSRVVSVHPERRAADLPALLDDNGIGSLAVVDWHDRLLGIVTDRLVLRALARRGPGMLSLAASDIMQSPAPTCDPADTVATVLRRMTGERIRHLVVLDEGRIAGLVSIGDLVKARLQDADLESRVLRDIALGHLAADPAAGASRPAQFPIRG